jgi:hypothetical protein
MNPSAVGRNFSIFAAHDFFGNFSGTKLPFASLNYETRAPSSDGGNRLSANNEKRVMKHPSLKFLGAAALLLAFTAGTPASTGSGAASAIPAYYDGNLLTIHFVEFSPQAEKALLQHNTSLNFIYQSDPGLPGGQPFVSVIDAVPGDGFNPIWEEVQVTFTPGHVPHQLFSDDEVLNAALNGEVDLTFTGEVYWCPVVGKK